MSEIAGRLAIEAAGVALRRQNGGRGILLGGVPGVLPASLYWAAALPEPKRHGWRPVLAPM
jgi:hypothetical protein